MLTVVLLIPALICYIVMAATYMPQAKYKNGMLFAIALPAHAFEHEEIRAIQVRFKKQYKQVNIALVVLIIPFVLLYAQFAYQFIYYCLWFTALCVAMVVPFRRAFRDTLALKREQGWFVGKAPDGTTVESDGDEYWANGFTYHNPNDKRLMVPKRIGIGEAINTGTQAGKNILWGSLVLTAAIIIGVSFMVIRSDMTTPMLIIAPDQRIEIKYPMYSFDFNAADIEEITLVDEIPSGLKANGEATNKYARGHFRLKELGRARLYVFKQNPPYIRIKLDDVYIFYNDADPLVTKQLHEQLLQYVKE